jgi:uncharacterized protein
MLFRAKFASNRKQLPSSILISVWRGLVNKRATKRGWNRFANEVADLSLMYWLDSVCEVCDGKGHPKIITAPTLAACVCPACDGTGQRKLKCRAEVKDYILDAVQQLESMEREAGVRAIKKLSNEARECRSVECGGATGIHFKEKIMSE